MRGIKLTIPESVFLASIIIAFGVIFLTISSPKKEEPVKNVPNEFMARAVELQEIYTLIANEGKRISALEDHRKSEPISVKLTEPIKVNVVYHQDIKKQLIPDDKIPAPRPMKKTSLTPMLDRAMESVRGKKK